MMILYPKISKALIALDTNSVVRCIGFFFYFNDIQKLNLYT